MCESDYIISRCVEQEVPGGGLASAHGQQDGHRARPGRRHDEGELAETAGEGQEDVAQLPSYSAAARCKQVSGSVV